jgi:hypothetical protein
LIAEQPIKITLQYSDGKNLHEIVSVGTGCGAMAQIFDHVGGFYFVGEGVPPDLLGPLHELFALYCRSHRQVTDAERHNPIHVQYRSFSEHNQHRMCMHFPTGVGKFHPPL